MQSCGDMTIQHAAFCKALVQGFASNTGSLVCSQYAMDASRVKELFRRSLDAKLAGKYLHVTQLHASVCISLL